MPASAFICGLSGERLKDDERQFLRASEPAGIILFGRNCTTRNQIYRLISEARDAIGREDTLVLVDQEGERVSRLKPPEWRPLIDAMEIADMAERDWSGALQTATALARLIAHDLREVGFNIACGPVLDMPTEDAHDIIGSRAFGRDLDTIIPLAHAFAEGLAELGVCPVGKHVPGHGRARSDTHHELAIVEVERETLAATDFAPFRAFSRLPAMMTAHVVFADIDDTEPASTSARVHTEVIRGDIGFDGLLMSDDINMAALDGTSGRRAERVIAAGSDIVLHCSGALDEMEAVAAVVPRLDGQSEARLQACHMSASRDEPVDVAEAEALIAAVRATRASGLPA